jgi:hypothetical protein
MSSGNRGNDALTRVFASRRPSCEGPALVTRIACVGSRARQHFAAFCVRPVHRVQGLRGVVGDGWSKPAITQPRPRTKDQRIRKPQPTGSFNAHIACVRSRARKAFFGCQIWPPSIPPFSRGEGRWNRRGVTGSGSLSLGLYGSFARIVWIRRTWFDGEIACPFTYLRDVSGHFTTRSICLAFNCRGTTQLGSKPKLRYGSSNPKSELAAQESWEQVCSEAICLLRVPQGSSKLNPSRLRLS